MTEHDFKFMCRVIILTIRSLVFVPAASVVGVVEIIAKEIMANIN